MNTCGDESDENGGDNRHKVDVAQYGHLGKAGRNSQAVEKDGRNDTEDQGADWPIGNGSEGDGTGKTVRPDKKNKK